MNKFRYKKKHKKSDISFEREEKETEDMIEDPFQGGRGVNN